MKSSNLIDRGKLSSLIHVGFNFENPRVLAKPKRIFTKEDESAAGEREKKQEWISSGEKRLTAYRR